MKHDVFSTQESLEKIFQENEDEMAQVSGEFAVSFTSIPDLDLAYSTFARSSLHR